MRGDTLVLRAGATIGRTMAVDARGRIYLPVCLLRHASFLVGTDRYDDGAAVVVVPAVLFDTIGDRLLERVR